MTSAIPSPHFGAVSAGSVRTNLVHRLPGLPAAFGRAFGLALAAAAVATQFERDILRSTFMPALNTEPLRFMFVFWMVASVAALVVVVGATARNARARARAESSRRLETEILEKLAMHAALGNQAAAVTRLAGIDRASTARALTAMIPSIRGYQSERLIKLEASLGFEARGSHHRRRQPGETGSPGRSAFSSRRRDAHHAMYRAPTDYVALASTEEAERVAAASSLIRTGEDAALRRVLAFAATQPITIRALLAEELRPHLLELDPAGIRELLDRSEPHQLAAILEIIVVWQRVFEAPSVVELLAASDPTVRALALRSLPIIAGVTGWESHVCGALSSSDPDVRSAAAFAAGQLNLGSAAPMLSEALSDSRSDVAVTAARALARLGDAGAAILKRAIQAGGGYAEVALEALEFGNSRESPVRS
jgi:HEAT repeats